jgi:UDP-2,3-diacylglucosamine hydrolase
MDGVLPLPARAGSSIPSWVTAAKPVLLASDVHLGAVRSRRERTFLAWLEHAASVSSGIILNGDLFDFWFEYRWGTTRGHEDVLALLRRVVASGVPVTLMGGNHDWWGGRFLREEIGIEFLQDPVVRDISGRRTLLAHGDGLGKGDSRYLVMRTVLRGGLTRAAFGLLPPPLGDRIARGVSRTERKWEEWGARQQARVNALEAWAEERLRQDPELELVVLGHTHHPQLREVVKGQWYVNSGDWVRHRTYVTLEVGREPRIAEWEAPA